MTETLQQKVDRYACVIKLQMEEIDQLRGEVERLQAGANAHTTLQSIYRNPASPESLRVKAAAASLPHEVPKLLPERAPLDLDATEVIVPLKELVRARKERQLRLEGLPWEDSTGRNGNGKAAASTDSPDSPDNSGNTDDQ